MIEYTVKVYDNGTRSWWLNGQLHRECGLPAMEFANGSKRWFLNGKLHRKDGLPAVKCANGDKFWYLNGELHREDGPAIEYADGGKYWYLNGHELTEEEFFDRTPKPKNSKLVKFLKELLACLDDPEIRKGSIN